MFSFWREAGPEARRALVAAGFGWMLDAFDVMLYSLVLAAMMRDLGMGSATAGLLGSLTLAASAAGGLVFGVLADRFGRTRALSLSILLYAFFTAACGLAQNVAQLAVFRIFLGLGMGGEWASGGAGVGDLAGEASRQSARADAVVLGDRLRRGGDRHRLDTADIRMARCVSRRHPSRAFHALDPSERARA